MGGILRAVHPVYKFSRVGPPTRSGHRVMGALATISAFVCINRPPFFSMGTCWYDGVLSGRVVLWVASLAHSPRQRALCVWCAPTPSCASGQCNRRFFPVALHRSRMKRN